MAVKFETNIKSLLQLLLMSCCLATVASWAVFQHPPPLRSFLTKEKSSGDKRNCGGFEVQWGQNKGQCGVCGDDAKHQRNVDLSAVKFTPVDVRNEQIEVRLYHAPNLQGYFEFRICDAGNASSLANVTCHQHQPFIVQDVNDVRYYPDVDKHLTSLRIQLPRAMNCRKCLVQWKYRTGYRQNPAPNNCTGCGPQEEFYDCALVRLHRQLPVRFRRQATGPLLPEVQPVPSNPTFRWTDSPANPDAALNVQAQPSAGRELVDSAVSTNVSSVTNINMKVTSNSSLPNALMEVNATDSSLWQSNYTAGNDTALDSTLDVNTTSDMTTALSVVSSTLGSAGKELIASIISMSSSVSSPNGTASSTVINTTGESASEIALAMQAGTKQHSGYNASLTDSHIATDSELNTTTILHSKSVDYLPNLEEKIDSFGGLPVQGTNYPTRSLSENALSTTHGSINGDGNSTVTSQMGGSFGINFREGQRGVSMVGEQEPGVKIITNSRMESETNNSSNVLDGKHSIHITSHHIINVVKTNEANSISTGSSDNRLASSGGVESGQNIGVENSRTTSGITMSRANPILTDSSLSTAATGMKMAETNSESHPPEIITGSASFPQTEPTVAETKRVLPTFVDARGNRILINRGSISTNGVAGNVDQVNTVGMNQVGTAEVNMNQAATVTTGNMGSGQMVGGTTGTGTTMWRGVSTNTGLSAEAVGTNQNQASTLTVGNTVTGQMVGGTSGTGATMWRGVSMTTDQNMGASPRLSNTGLEAEAVGLNRNQAFTVTSGNTVSEQMVGEGRGTDATVWRGVSLSADQTADANTGLSNTGLAFTNEGINGNQLTSMTSLGASSGLSNTGLAANSVGSNQNQAMLTTNGQMVEGTSGTGATMWRGVSMATDRNMGTNPGLINTGLAAETVGINQNQATTGAIGGTVSGQMIGGTSGTGTTMTRGVVTADQSMSASSGLSNTGLAPNAVGINQNQATTVTNSQTVSGQMVGVTTDTGNTVWRGVSMTADQTGVANTRLSNAGLEAGVVGMNRNQATTMAEDNTMSGQMVGGTRGTGSTIWRGVSTTADMNMGASSGLPNTGLAAKAVEMNVNQATAMTEGNTMSEQTRGTGNTVWRGVSMTADQTVGAANTGLSTTGMNQEAVATNQNQATTVTEGNTLSGQMTGGGSGTGTTVWRGVSMTADETAGAANTGLPNTGLGSERVWYADANANQPYQPIVQPTATLGTEQIPGMTSGSTNEIKSNVGVDVTNFATVQPASVDATNMATIMATNMASNMAADNVMDGPYSIPPPIIAASVVRTTAVEPEQQSGLIGETSTLSVAEAPTGNWNSDFSGVPTLHKMSMDSSDVMLSGTQSSSSPMSSETLEQKNQEMVNLANLVALRRNLDMVARAIGNAGMKPAAGAAVGEAIQNTKSSTAGSLDSQGLATLLSGYVNNENTGQGMASSNMNDLSGAVNVVSNSISSGIQEGSQMNWLNSGMSGNDWQNPTAPSSVEGNIVSRELFAGDSKRVPLTTSPDIGFRKSIVRMDETVNRQPGMWSMTSNDMIQPMQSLPGRTETIAVSSSTDNSGQLNTWTQRRADSTDFHSPPTDSVARVADGGNQFMASIGNGTGQANSRILKTLETLVRVSKEGANSTVEQVNPAGPSGLLTVSNANQDAMTLYQFMNNHQVGSGSQSSPSATGSSGVTSQLSNTLLQPPPVGLPSVEANAAGTSQAAISSGMEVGLATQGSAANNVNYENNMAWTSPGQSVGGSSQTVNTWSLGSTSGTSGTRIPDGQQGGVWESPKNLLSPEVNPENVRRLDLGIFNTVMTAGVDGTMRQPWMSPSVPASELGFNSPQSPDGKMQGSIMSWSEQNSMPSLQMGTGIGGQQRGLENPFSSSASQLGESGFSINQNQIGGIGFESSMASTSNVGLGLADSAANDGKKFSVPELSSGLCEPNEAFVCTALGDYRSIPGMEWWCFSHCKHGICPDTKCQCSCQPVTGNSGQRARTVRVENMGLPTDTTTAKPTVAAESKTPRTKKVITLTLSGSKEDFVPLNSNDGTVSAKVSGTAVIGPNDIRVSQNRLQVGLTNCKGVHAFEKTAGIKDWCQMMCDQGVCPNDICICSN